MFILESGKSATSVAEEMGIDVNTVCRWVRDYRRKNNLPRGYIMKISLDELFLYRQYTDYPMEFYYDKKKKVVLPKDYVKFDDSTSAIIPSHT